MGFIFIFLNFGRGVEWVYLFIVPFNVCNLLFLNLEG